MVQQKEQLESFAQQLTAHWFVKAIFWPFILTRCILLIAGWSAQYILTLNFSHDAEVMARGWFFSSHRLIDMWARWDSGWYMDIIKFGYRMGESVYVTSNLAFFPFFPYLIKFSTLLVPKQFLTDEVILVTGLLLSNIFLLAALVVLYKITIFLLKNEQTARRTIWFLLVFPSSFFLSSFYTESTFLFFSLVSFWAAFQRKWWLSCCAATVLGATRPVGLVIGLPLLVEYLQSKDWHLRKLDLSIFWFAVIPVGIGLFFWYLYTITGDFFAAVKVQSAWGRKLTDPLTTLMLPTGFWQYITPLDQFLIVTALLSTISLLREKLKGHVSLGLYALLLILPTLFTGTLDSVSRFMVVIFPLFIYWAFLTEKTPKLNFFVMMIAMSLQVIYFGLFSQFYWAG